MGVFRSFKSWIKRAVIRIVLRVASTRFVRFMRKLARKSVIPLSITCGGVLIGVGVASTIGSSILAGALIGGGIGISGLVITKLYEMHAANIRNSRRLRLNYFVIRSNMESSSSSRTRVVETTATPRRF